MKSRRGQSFVELTAGLLVVIPVILLCIDIATIYMGVELNSSVCRDAARAASLGAPDAINSGEPRRRAEGVVRKANKTAGAVRLDPNVQVTENVNSTNLPTAPFGGPVEGDVTVATSVDIYPPFLLSCFTQQGGGLKFTTNQTFAYTWSMANTSRAPGQSNPGRQY
jgi:Flp pilus assembly protein TadG